MKIGKKQKKRKVGRPLESRRKSHMDKQHNLEEACTNV
jgi:hypothetical protein